MADEIKMLPAGSASVEGYISTDKGLKLIREFGTSVQIDGTNVNLDSRWVLRKNGAYVDHSAYRNDLAERNNLIIGS